MSTSKAPVSEIFSSLQGEGPRTGERQIFIRFGGCHRECAYCDEADKKSRDMSLGAVLRKIAKIEKILGPHRWVSLTGGEPLLRADFLVALCARLRRKGHRILLETNGILWRPFSKVVKVCDLIAMDLKLASVTRQTGCLEEHRRFLRLASRKETYIKIVISENVDRHEFDEHLRMVRRVAPKTPVFLQPMDVRRGSYPNPRLMRLLDGLQKRGARHLSDIRIGIQLHKLLGIR